MGNGTIDNDRADRINHHLAAAQREIRDAVNSPGSRETINLQEGGDITTLLQTAKDEINRRRAVDDAEPGSTAQRDSEQGAG